MYQNGDTVSVMPKLTEPGVKGFIKYTLGECRRFNERHNTLIFNLYAGGILIVVFGGILFFMYKGKLTPHEKEVKNRKKHEYIMRNLQKYAQMRNKDNLITNLPGWS